MKIAFWSNGDEKMCVTSNMACIASMISLRSAGKVKEVLIENHLNRNKSLEDVLIQQVQQDFFRETGGYYIKYGLEYILKRIYLGDRYEELIRNSTVNLLLSNMFLLPSGVVFNKEVFNYDFSLVHKELFRLLEKVGEYVFIDTESKHNLSTKQILFDADIVVVNLTQNAESIRDFFENYTSIREKAVYMVGKYQPNRKWTRKRICYEYNVPRNKIGIIPYCIDFEEAIYYGKIQQFLNCNYLKASSKENEYFIRQCKKSAKIIQDTILELGKNKGKSGNWQEIEKICEKDEWVYSNKTDFGREYYMKENINPYK